MKNATDHRYLLTNETVKFIQITTNTTSTKEVCLYFQQLLATHGTISNNIDNVDDIEDDGGTSLNTWSIFHWSETKKQLLEINVIISLLSLVISFIIYCLLPNLRTVPGKCLMGLICSEFAANLLLFLGIKFQLPTRNIFCILVAILIHYFFLSTLSWTNLIAFDILKKVRVPTLVLRGSIRHFLIAYISPLPILTMTLVLDFVHISPRSMLRLLKPYYGKSMCGISNLRAQFIFIIIPVFFSFCFNMITLVSAIIKIKTVARNNQISSNLNPSFNIQKRFFCYVKLCVLLGILNLFTLIGNTFINGCQMPNFLTLMFISSHGTFIFIAFICKKSIFRLLCKHFTKNYSKSDSRLGSTNERTPTFSNNCNRFIYSHHGSYI